MGESKQTKHIISISLGSSKRDASAMLELTGQCISSAVVLMAILTKHDCLWSSGTVRLMLWDLVVRTFMFMLARSVTPFVSLHT